MAGKYIEKIFEKEFKAETYKKAYLKAIKWVATNIIAKDELKDTVISYEKEDEDCNTIKVIAYVSIDENLIRQKHCKICKESHCQFYISEYTNCDWCNCKAYQKRTDMELKNKRQFYKAAFKGL